MIRLGRGLLVISLLLVTSCSKETTRSNELLGDVLTGPSSTTTQPELTTTVPAADPAVLLRSLVETSGIAFTTPVISHSCGTFALIHDDAEPTILKWDDTEWTNASFAFATTFDPGVFVEQHWIADVTSDGEPEIILNWFYDGGNRSFGQVVSASSPECTWHYLSTIESCGDSEVVDNLTYVPNGQLQGSGFINCSGERAGMKLTWDPVLGVFIAGPLDGEKYCNGLTETIDLPLSTCSESWAIQMAQRVLVERGAQIDTDGQYGPATQLAVLRLQQSLGIQLSGQLDGETWASLFPAGTDEYPDFDGDGVSSPREIGHASGALENYEEGTGSGAPLSPRVTVVRTYCEQRRTALTSDMRGPLIEYRLITEYSNGRKKYEVVGTSWSNLSGKCP